MPGIAATPMTAMTRSDSENRYLDTELGASFDPKKDHALEDGGSGARESLIPMLSPAQHLSEYVKAEEQLPLLCR
ncbi:hypothetical protein [Arthrobacter sp.]|uniref:hypothetical protein n=1 Tax=Arthrobacter sp. TaxID=1667 RepID=UPI002811EEAD|nr:hypothetical protein [Arthrobacter sp.]